MGPRRALRPYATGCCLGVRHSPGGQRQPGLPQRTGCVGRASPGGRGKRQGQSVLEKEHRARPRQGRSRRPSPGLQLRCSRWGGTRHRRRDCRCVPRERPSHVRQPKSGLTVRHGIRGRRYRYRQTGEHKPAPRTCPCLSQLAPLRQGARVVSVADTAAARRREQRPC